MLEGGERSTTELSLQQEAYNVLAVMDADAKGKTTLRFGPSQNSSELFLLLKEKLT